jgi:hypothetical protein
MAVADVADLDRILVNSENLKTLRGAFDQKASIASVTPAYITVTQRDAVAHVMTSDSIGRAQSWAGS